MRIIISLFTMALLIFCINSHALEIKLKPLMLSTKQYVQPSCSEILVTDPLRLVSFSSTNSVGYRYAPNASPDSIASTYVEILNLTDKVATHSGKSLPFDLVGGVNRLNFSGIAAHQFLGRQSGTGVLYFVGHKPELMTVSPSPREGNLYVNKSALFSWDSISSDSPIREIADVNRRSSPTVYLPHLGIFLTLDENYFLDSNGNEFQDAKFTELIFGSNGLDVDSATEKIKIAANPRNAYNVFAKSPDGRYLVVALEKKRSIGVEIGAINGNPKIVFFPENSRESTVIRIIDLKEKGIVQEFDVDSKIIRKPVFTKKGLIYIASSIGLYRVDLKSRKLNYEPKILVHEKDRKLEWPMGDLASIDQYSRIMVSDDDKFIVSVKDGTKSSFMQNSDGASIWVYKRDSSGNFERHAVLVNDSYCKSFRLAANKIVNNLLIIMCADHPSSPAPYRLAAINLESLNYETVDSEMFNLRGEPRLFVFDPSERVAFITTLGEQGAVTGNTNPVKAEVAVFSLSIRK